uniref:Ovule protein n=1 Tax=Ascaris lumbricoides TaxID=6252 RepID=A0A0M3HY16_ASCLU
MEYIHSPLKRELVYITNWSFRAIKERTEENIASWSCGVSTCVQQTCALLCVWALKRKHKTFLCSANMPTPANRSWQRAPGKSMKTVSND